MKAKEHGMLLEHGMYITFEFDNQITNSNWENIHCYIFPKIILCI